MNYRLSKFGIIFNITKDCIAFLTKDAANLSGHMIVVHVGPLFTPIGFTAKWHILRLDY